MVGRPFIGKRGGGGQHRVVGEVLLIAENRLEYAPRGARLQVAVEARLQIGRGKVHPSIRRIHAGRNGARVGGPHAGRRAHRPQQLWRLLRRSSEDLAVAAAEAQVAQRAQVRPLLRGQNSLGVACVHQRLHLGQPLQRALSGVGNQAPVAHGGHITVGQSRVVVGQPDQTVEVDFPNAVDAHRVTPGGRVSGISRLSASMEATG